MGVSVSFEGLPSSGDSGSLPVVSYSVTEATTPISAGDSSGQIGTFSVTVRMPDPHLTKPSTGPSRTLWDDGPEVFSGATVTLQDTTDGVVTGYIVSSQESDDGSSVTFIAISGPKPLNTYDLSMPPNEFTTLEGLLFDYFNIIGIPYPQLNINVPEIYLSAPGWQGEFWHHLKMLVTAYDQEVTLTNGVITIQPIRLREQSLRGATTRSKQLQVQSLARSVEVYQYNNVPLTGADTGGLAYPPGGWNPEVEILNVNAGEEAEYTLELSSSLSGITPPVMMTNVSPDHNSSSVYTVIANDGLPVTPQAWSDYGGSVSVEVGSDTTSLVVKMRGAVGLPTTTGEEATSFSLALASDTSGSRYSTLRIVGTGVSFDKKKVTIRTGVPDSDTATDVGLTVDNPFLSTAAQVYRTGIRAARSFAGPAHSLSGDIAPLPGVNPLGSLSGSRVYDPKSRRWYRVRGATRSRGASFTADDDLTWDDAQEMLQGKTYDQVQAEWGRLTYNQVERRGLRWP